MRVEKECEQRRSTSRERVEKESERSARRERSASRLRESREEVRAENKV